MKRPSHALALCAAAVAFAGPSKVLAAEDADIQEGPEAPASTTTDTRDLEGLLEEAVVTTSSFSVETARTAPATSWTITASELQRFGITTLAQAINFLSLGMIAEHKIDVAEVGVRGVLLSGDYGGHILLLLDGHTLNEQWDGSIYFDRAAAIPFDLIDHIEVVLGPGSVLYGSNAMLGVINVITKQARELGRLRASVEVERINALHTALSGGQQFEWFGTRGEAIVGVDYYRARGPRLTLGPQDYGNDAVTDEPRRFSDTVPGTGIWGGTLDDGRQADIPSGYLRATWGEVSADLRAASVKHISSFSTYENFNDPDSYQRERWLSGDLRWRHRLSQAVGLSARAYGDTYDYFEQLPTRAAENCLDGQTEGCVYRLNGATQWGGLELRISFDWLSNAKLVTLVGADGRLRGISSDSFYIDWLTQGDTTVNEYDYFEKALGAYIEQTAQPTAWLNFNAGARFDDDERFGSHLSPRVAASVSPWSDGFLKGIYSEAFRAPNAFETYYADPASWVVADQIEPEQVRSFEVSFEQRVSTVRVLVAGFCSKWSKMITGATLSEDELNIAKANGEIEQAVEDAGRYENSGEINSYGANLAINGTAWSRRLRYGATLTVAHTRLSPGQDAEDEELPAVGELFGNAQVSYDLGDSLPTVALAGRFIEARLADYSEFDPWTKAPAQVELRLTVSGALPFFPSLSYRASGSYALSDRSPYSIGPLSGPTDTYLEQELAPIERYSVLVGLQYVLGP